MNIPTEEQIKEFWEWCGFEIKESKGEKISELYGVDVFDWTRSVTYPDKYVDYDLPELDPNNLFKWAVPKTTKILGDRDLSSDEEAMWKLFGLWLKEYWKPRAVPISIGDALFWAIRKVIKGAK